MNEKIDTELLVKNFPRKYEEGFLNEEIDKILDIVEDLRIEFNKSRFESALRGITCAVVGGNTVIYSYDLELALRCGLRGYGITANEWD